MQYYKEWLEESFTKNGSKFTNMEDLRRASHTVTFIIIKFIVHDEIENIETGSHDTITTPPWVEGP